MILLRAVCLSSVAVALIIPATACAAQTTANPGSFASVFAAAQPGDTVMLESGDYGTFSGSAKPGRVTVQGQPGAAARMNVRFQNATNITLSGVQLNDVEVSRTSRDITIAESAVSGSTVVRTTQMTDANVVFDGNTHQNIDVCSGCPEGRITLPGGGPNPSGVTIKNSLFSGGNADGIQNGANGVKILDNEFVNVIESGGVHTDSIQLYGSKNTLVSGNYLHNNSSGIVSFDCCQSNDTITNNVLDIIGPNALVVASHSGSTITHNTVKGDSIVYGSKTGDPGSSNLTIRDNIAAGISQASGTNTGLTSDHNLCGRGCGSANTTGTPSYVGGANPTTRAGFALAAGSPGKGTASDGGDRGARFEVVAAAGPGAAAPAGGGGASVAPPAPSATVLSGRPAPTVRLSSRLASVGRTGRLRLRVRTSTPGFVVLAATVRPGFSQRTGRRMTSVLRPRTRATRFSRPGERIVTVQLTRHARRLLARAHDAGVVVMTYANRGRRTPTGRTLLRLRR